MANPSKVRLTEEQLLAKYPWVKPGTLRYEAGASRQAVTCICEQCKREHDRWTQDVFNHRFCPECLARGRRERKRKVRAATILLATMTVLPKAEVIR